MAKTNNKKVIIGWLTAVVLMLIVFAIPTGELFTAAIRKFMMATVFFVAIMAFELLPNFIIAVLLPATYVLIGLCDISTAFASYASQNVWMALGAFVLGNVMDQTGLLKRIAYAIIRAMGGSFKGAVFGSFLVAFIINFVTFGAGWVTCLPVVIGIVKALDLKPGRESAIVCFAGLIGGCDAGCFVYVPSSQAWLDSFIQPFAPEFTSNFFTPLLYNGFMLVGGLLSLVVMLWLNDRQNKKNPGEMTVNATKEYFDTLYKELGAMSANEKKSLALFAVLLVYTIAAGFMKWPTAYGFMVVPYLAYVPFIRCDDGEALKKTQFQGLFFYASCIAIGSVGALVGFSNMLATLALPLMEGKSMLVVCIIMILVATVAKLALTPSALLGGFGGAYAQIGATLGMHPAAAVYLLFSASVYIFFPFGITGYLLMYSSGYIPMKEFLKNQVLKTALIWIVFIVIWFPLLKLLGMI